MAGTMSAIPLQSPTKCSCNNLQKVFATLCKKYLQKTGQTPIWSQPQ